MKKGWFFLVLSLLCIFPVEGIGQDIITPPIYYDIKTNQTMNITHFPSHYLSIVFLSFTIHDFFANLTTLNACFNASDMSILILYVGDKCMFSNPDQYLKDALFNINQTLTFYPYNGSIGILPTLTKASFYYAYRNYVHVIDLQSQTIVGNVNIYNEQELYELYLSLELVPLSIPEKYSNIFKNPKKTNASMLFIFLAFIISYRIKRNEKW